MDYGYRTAATATFDITIGDVQANAAKIKEIIRKEVCRDTDILIFPELCITGYTCADMFLRKYLTDAAAKALYDIACMTDTKKYPDIWQDHISPVIVIGLPARCEGKLFNCAAFICNGNILAVVPKTYLPNYNEYYEKRWFASAYECKADHIDICGRSIPFGNNIIIETSTGLKIGCEICEDLWTPVPPSSILTSLGANVIVNPSASNDYISKREYRKKLISLQSARCSCAYIYVSAGSGESTSDMLFSGQHIAAECGNIKQDFSSYLQKDDIVKRSVIDIEKIENDKVRYNSFSLRHNESARYIYTDIAMDEKRSSYHMPEYINPYPFVPKDKQSRVERCKEILSIQGAALAQRLVKTHIKKSVIGISGGLDSTLALLAVKEAYDLLGYPYKDIITVTMPGFGTGSLTKTSADNLMSLLGTDARTVDIKKACLQHMSDIGQDENTYDVTYENIQARERTQILMDIANKEGGLVIGTGDLSELALGWCTYNGDHMSMYGINASIPKTLVRFIIETAAEAQSDPRMKETLLGICDTPISPELLPPDENGNISQSTEKILGKYDLHDFFLYHYIRNGFGREKINALAYIAFPNVPRDDIDRALGVFMTRFAANQFKRNCMPDGPKVGTVALSPRGDWRMPSDYQGD